MGSAILKKYLHKDNYSQNLISRQKEIDSVIDKEGVVVSSDGTLIQGIIGIGGEKKGYIKITSKLLKKLELSVVFRKILPIKIFHNGSEIIILKKDSNKKISP